jgi:hypothetical protein
MKRLLLALTAATLIFLSAKKQKKKSQAKELDIEAFRNNGLI